jgi:hypothetical protein
MPKASRFRRVVEAGHAGRPGRCCCAVFFANRRVDAGLVETMSALAKVLPGQSSFDGALI